VRGGNEALEGLPGLLDALLAKRVLLQGFLAPDLEPLRPQFERDMASWIAAGQVRYREHVLEGLERAPEALAMVLDGRNFGKMLVRLP